MNFNQDNERPDIALEHEKSESQKRENYWNQFNKSYPEPKYATEESGIKISEIVLNLFKKGGGSALYYEEQIYFNMDTHEAVEDALLSAITPEGWDSPITEWEQVNYNLSSHGGEVEIIIEIYPQEEVIED
ncbi:MAG: hypothetical protein NVS2B14_00170 [Chamaesiphon sp.]